ncbi:hypothetical protein GE21DRAFT_6167 [Neurospora crassa]|uniref:F-box domain-containing protein n=2 Tax=Neurospora crassa TaxID=5141 RepID=Q7RW63_NEUCR|nr:hypothetical protein NCU04357 [Neurospora crassa OR74A]EAA26593.1 hypothetical protein NCU04357 [Neurospora crassa OR74A]KHE82317.1 hypothetical protein GE21DRAFT_6167 [Neurospora crassa]CAF06091.1 hypothetical protein 29E8.580 [Neurospora crassa]|eukprot:XP_955829.1 hypothetical protein NCU04357 [Neurospora crassa OR74A]
MANQSKISFLSLPVELRIRIYRLTWDLDPEPYTFSIILYHNPGSLKHDLLKDQLTQLRKLNSLCRFIRSEALSEFFWQTQVYLRHEPYSNIDGAWYSDEYQQGLDLIIRDPLLAKYTRHVYWAIMLDEDVDDIDRHKHRGIREYTPEFKVPDMPWPWESYYFVMRLPNLTTLHVDVETYKDWRDLRMWSRCMAELYEWPTMKKITLRLTFKTAKSIVRKAYRSRWVRRGRSQERLTRNILNHLLTLPKDTYQDAPCHIIQNHFGYQCPVWRREKRF